MEERLNKKVNDYLSEYKDAICTKVIEEYSLNEQEKKNIIEFIYEYKNLKFESTDLNKRKREKNTIPKYNRCLARRANGEQCTRRRKGESDLYCGTHIKGQPHGDIEKDKNLKEEKKDHKKIEVYGLDIKGILYYVDDKNNVYDTEDILENKINPKIIGRYVKNEETGELSIPDMNLFI